MLDVELLTARLALRTPRRRDARPMEAVLDPTVVEAQGWRPEDRTAWLQYVRGRSALAGTPGLQMLVVCDRADGSVLGTVSVDAARELPTVGLILGPAGRGRGLGREALEGALAHFHDIGIRALAIETAKDNAAMRRIAETLGFIAQDHYVHVLPNGVQTPAVRYVLQL
jgi:RimJ/RimL family protein N-acetyltransferase